MIELNKKTEQDFLNKKWVNKLQEAGIDMSDAKYCIVDKEDKSYIILKNEVTGEYLPTYSLAELIYKINEYPATSVPEGSLSSWYMHKDAPFYPVGFAVTTEEGKKYPDNYMWAFDSPLYGMAALLIWCTKNNVWYVKDISDKLVYDN